MEKKASPYKNIDNYIAAQPVTIRPTLQKLRQVIRQTIPSAEEVISYQMPAFRLHGVVIYFAAFKNHYSIFLRPKHLDPFRKELIAYKTSKSAVNIPLNKPVPVKLVTMLTKHAAKENRIAAEKEKN